MFTLVIPLKNADRSLPATLQSITSQTNHCLHVLCVNDGASAESLECVRKHALKDNRFQIVPLEKNLLRTIRPYCDGRYLLFLESGDALLPNCCARIRNVIQNDCPEIVIAMANGAPATTIVRAAHSRETPTIEERAGHLLGHHLRGHFISRDYLFRSVRKRKLRPNAGLSVLGWTTLLTAKTVLVTAEKLITPNPSPTVRLTAGGFDARVAELASLKNALETKGLMDRLEEYYLRYKFNTVYSFFQRDAELKKKVSLKNFCQQLTQDEVRFICTSQFVDEEFKFFFMEHLDVNPEQLKRQMILSLRNSNTRLTTTLHKLNSMQKSVSHVAGKNETVRLISVQQQSISELNAENEKLRNEIKKLKGRIQTVQRDTRLSRIALRVAMTPIRLAGYLLTFLNPFSYLKKKNAKKTAKPTPVKQQSAALKKDVLPAKQNKKAG